MRSAGFPPVALSAQRCLAGIVPFLARILGPGLDWLLSMAMAPEGGGSPSLRLLPRGGRCESAGGKSSSIAGGQSMLTLAGKGGAWDALGVVLVGCRALRMVGLCGEACGWSPS